METSSSSARKKPQEEPLPLPYQLAKASWVAPLLVAGVVFLMRSAPPGDAVGSRTIVVSIVATALYVTGFACGVIALFAIPRLGWRGILIPAVVGISLNGTVLFFLVVALVTGNNP